MAGQCKERGRENVCACACACVSPMGVGDKGIYGNAVGKLSGQAVKRGAWMVESPRIRGLGARAHQLLNVLIE